MVQTTVTIVVVTLSLFFIAAIAEIGGGYLVWSWLRKKRN
jgi:drug/metabolite transporter superfamily protein YnfA